MRVRISPSCSSVLTRDCCSNRVSDSWVRLARIARSESRSDRDSIMPRESCCMWVKRSNSFLAVLDLRLGFDLEGPQLLAQTGDRLVQLAQVVAEGVGLLLQARAVDAHLAGEIDQVVQQFGAHAHLLLRRQPWRLAPFGLIGFRQGWCGVSASGAGTGSVAGFSSTTLSPREAGSPASAPPRCRHVRPAPRFAFRWSAFRLQPRGQTCRPRPATSPASVQLPRPGVRVHRFRPPTRSRQQSRQAPRHPRRSPARRLPRSRGCRLPPSRGWRSPHR